MVNTLASFPLLPLLNFEQAKKVLDDANISRSARAQLAGISRVMLWKCDAGISEPQTKTLECMSLLAYKVAAYRLAGGAPFPSKCSASQIERQLNYNPIFLAQNGTELYKLVTAQEQ